MIQLAKVLLCPGKCPVSYSFRGQDLKKAYERCFSSSKTELRIRSPCRSVEDKSLREHFESSSTEQDKSQEGRSGSAGIMQHALLNAENVESPTKPAPQ